jgi:DNA polymerase-3 subunit beta
VIRIFPPSSQLQCAFDDHQFCITHETIQLISRLIDGDYPDYDAVVPKTFTGDFLIEHSQFIHALKLVSNFSGKVNDIHLSLSDDGKSLTISSANSYIGENRYVIPVKSNGERCKDLVFHWRYLLDGARVISSTEISFSFNGDAKPGLITSTKDSSYYYVVMPIRMQ